MGCGRRGVKGHGRRDVKGCGWRVWKGCGRGGVGVHNGKGDITEDVHCLSKDDTHTCVHTLYMCVDRYAYMYT